MTTLAGISYLNSRPLLAALGTEVAFPGAIRIVRPPEANLLLLSGGADLGLLSAIAWARQAEDFLLLDRIAIASCGPIRSIRCYGPENPRRILADSDSETAAALVRILHPGAEVTRDSPGVARDLTDADGELKIGDAALGDDRPHRDLGAIWTERTGLPFIWAVGVVRRDALARDPAGIRSAVLAWFEAAARGEAQDRREAIARESGVPPDLACAYLTALQRAGRHPRRWDGLARFLDEALRRGLLAPRRAPPRLDFYAPGTTISAFNG